jgi:hypothetical protein
MPGLCKYAHIFGKEGEGPHSYRLFNIAVVDVLLTIIGAAVIAYIAGWNFWITLLATFLTGIFAHRLFCVNTTVNKMIFGEI